MLRSSDYANLGAAIFVGAIVGGLVAKWIGSPYWWPLGAILGGILGYVIVDFKHFAAGVRKTYRTYVTWEPDRLYWRAYGMLMLGATMCYLTFVLIPIGTILFLAGNNKSVQGLILFWSMIGTPIWLGVPVGALLRAHRERTEKEYRAKLERRYHTGWKLVLQTNPITAPWFCVILPAARMTKRCYEHTVASIKAIPDAMCTTKEIALTLLYHVHYDLRLFAGIWAAIGVIAGWFSDHLLISAVAAAILGTMDYYLLWVRWMSKFAR